MSLPRTARRATPLLLVLAFVVTACMPAPALHSLQLVNEERAHRNIRPLEYHPTLGAKAQAWAEQLAARGTLSHSNLADGAGPGWRSLGENLAMASSIEEAHHRLMNSSGHRASILNRNYTHLGVGVAESGGRFWVVQVFGG